MMVRPVFLNEILGKNNGKFEPQYDIISGDGEVVAENTMLRLKNPILAEGTPLNSVNLTNLYDFDNMESMRGNRKTTVFNDDGSIAETIMEIGSNMVNARRETTFPTVNTVRVITTVFADNGVDVLRQTTVDTAVGANIVESVT